MQWNTNKELNETHPAPNSNSLFVDETQINEMPESRKEVMNQHVHKVSYLVLVMFWVRVRVRVMILRPCPNSPPSPRFKP